MQRKRYASRALVLAKDKTLAVLSRVRRASIAQVLSVTPFVLLVSSAAASAIVLLQRLVQSESPRGPVVLCVALGGTGLSALLFITRRAWANAHVPDRLDQRHRDLAKSFILSLQIGVLLLVVTAYLAVWQNRNHSLEWFQFGFLDKRWLLSLYWIAILTALVLPAVLFRLVAADQTVCSADAHARADNGSTGARTRRGRLIGGWLCKAGLALLIATLMYGPPWNIQRTSLAVNTHEQVHLGPLQAVDRGYLPNIGPASIQYGPGTQVLTYAYMKLSGQFSLIGFREAQALICYVGYFALALAALTCLRMEWVVLMIVLSLSASPFKQIRWNSLGGLVIWGWPNPLRYMGSLVMILTLPPVARGSASQRAWRALGAGVIWGGFCWFAQENLLMGILGAAMLLALMWATGAISLGNVLRVSVLVGLGALTLWLPILLFYLCQGELGAYLRNYFLVGGQVLSGFSNTGVNPNITSTPYLRRILYYCSPTLVLVGLSALYGGSKFCWPLDKRRLALVASICVTVTSLFGALPRPDASHLLNTLASLPLTLALAAQEVPSFLASRTFSRTILRLLLLVIALAFAAGIRDVSLYRVAAEGRLQRYQHFESQQEGLTDQAGVAFARTGYDSIAGDDLFHGSPPAPTWTVLGALDEIRELVGESEVYVHSFPHPYILPGLVYFLADLTPPSLLLDPTTMVFSGDVRQQFLEHFELIAADVRYVVTARIDVREVDIFLAAHPSASILTRAFGDQEYYVIGYFPGEEAREGAASAW